MALSNYDKFCSSEEGAKHMASKAFTCALDKGGAVWVPAGCLWAMAYYRDDSKKKKKPTAEEEEFADVLCIPCITSKLMQPLSELVQRQCLAYGKDGLKTKDTPMWNGRKELLANVFKVDA